MFIDSHCHLNHEHFEGDMAAALARARAAGVGKMIVVGFDVESSMAALKLAEKHTELFAAVAVHPHDAKSYNSGVESMLREMASNQRVVAVGEIGLDFHYNFSTPDQQQKAFESQLALARELGLPVIIHCREAYPETLDVLDSGLRRELSGVMHCWAEAPSDAERALTLGMYLGFGGIITFNNADSTRDTLLSTPLNRVLLETDAPYLAPVPYRGKRNEPAYVPIIAAHAAKVTGHDLRTIESDTTENTLRLFPRMQEASLTGSTGF